MSCERFNYSYEVFEVTQGTDRRDIEGYALEPGWYYWYCFPGCRPDTEPIGPFESEAEAEAAIEDEIADLQARANLFADPND